MATTYKSSRRKMDAQEREQSQRRDALNSISYDLGMTPPQAIEVEEAVLGALLLEPHVVPEVLDQLVPGRSSRTSIPWLLPATPLTFIRLRKN